tara:strand:- start:127 stop:1632 length:1506 start_codon:yes stop_codon:yes gene_type:complete
LLRCFPQKTSLRNFTRYCGNAKNFTDDIVRHVLSSVRGMLVSDVLSADALRRVQAALDAASPHDFRRWLVGPPPRFAPMYLALRWRVVSAVRDVPALRAAIQQHMAAWQTYENFIMTQVDTVRRAVNAAAPSERLLAACDNAVGNTRGMRVVISSAPSAMAAMVRRASVVNSVMRTRQSPPCDRNHELMSQLLRFAWRASSVQIVHMLAQVGMCPSALHFWSQPSLSTDRRAVVQWLPTLVHDQLQLTLELARALLVRGKARLHRLSLNCLRQQVQSRARRTKLNLLTTKSYIFACPTCHQIRGFVCPATCCNGTLAPVPVPGMDNYCAMGTSRCIVDFDEQLLYCGRRVERSTMGGVDCRHSLLLRIPIDGYMLEWFGQFVVLCPGCTRLVAHPSMPNTNEQTYGPDGLFRCVRCRCGGDETPVAQQPPCSHCGETVTSSSSLRWRDCVFCSRCRRKWMLTGNAAEKLDMRVVHQAIDERWNPSRVARVAAEAARLQQRH